MPNTAPGSRDRRVGARALDEPTFTRHLRYELAAAEGRALVASYAIAVTLGVLWLVLVHLLPAPPRVIQLLRPEETAPVQVTFESAPVTPPAPARSAPSPPPPAPSKTASKAAADGSEKTRPRDDAQAISAAFGGDPGTGGGMVGDVSDVLRGVDVATAGAPGSDAAAGGKAVIGYGNGGQGVRTPGRGGLGTGLGISGASVGGVSGGGGIGHAAVSVAPPSVIHAPRLGRPGRDVSELGSYVRGRESQLQFCYQEYGLKVNADLAGTVAVEVALAASGAVTDVTITNRTWSGPGAREVEACLRSRIAAWKFPAAPGDADGGKYGFSFVFSR